MKKDIAIIIILYLNWLLLFSLQFFDVHTDFDVFRKLPDTMRRMADRLLDSDSVLNQHTVGTLNSSHPTDLKLMGELQMVQDVFNTVCIAHVCEKGDM